MENEEIKNQQEQEQKIEDQKQDVKTEFKGFFQSAKIFLKELLDINEGTNKEDTINRIIENIPVKNHTAWILVFSIFIASIGLNVSSTAVVIGAMLISPLMGPILGLGLSIGINDIDTLKRSLVNLGVMVGLSLATSFLFFSIPLFREATPEILARTKPDVRDVLIAIFGGLTMIVALSRKKELAGSMAGVAIATALMPPLCTAGYGLATWNLNFFFGAMFLFLINTIFIALATFIMVKFLRFPMVRYINQAKRKRVAQLAGAIATIIIGFSVYQFYLLYQENKFKTDAEQFITELTESTRAGIIDSQIDYKKKNIKLVVLGSNITEDDKTIWSNKMTDFGLQNTALIIQQDDKTSLLQNEINTIKSSYVKNQNLIATKDEIILQKEGIIIEKEKELQQFYKKQIPFVQISQEAKIIYTHLAGLSYSDKLVTNFSSIDTLRVFEATWNNKNIQDEEKQFKKWLSIRLKADKLELVNFYDTTISRDSLQ